MGNGGWVSTCKYNFLLPFHSFNLFSLRLTWILEVNLITKPVKIILMIVPLYKRDLKTFKFAAVSECAFFSHLPEAKTYVKHIFWQFSFCSISQDSYWNKPQPMKNKTDKTKNNKTNKNKQTKQNKKQTRTKQRNNWKTLQQNLLYTKVNTKQNNTTQHKIK